MNYTEFQAMVKEARKLGNPGGMRLTDLRRGQRLSIMTPTTSRSRRISEESARFREDSRNYWSMGAAGRIAYDKALRAYGKKIMPALEARDRNAETSRMLQSGNETDRQLALNRLMSAELNYWKPHPYNTVSGGNGSSGMLEDVIRDNYRNLIYSRGRQFDPYTDFMTPKIRLGLASVGTRFDPGMLPLPKSQRQQYQPQQYQQYQQQQQQQVPKATEQNSDIWDYSPKVEYNGHYSV